MLSVIDSLDISARRSRGIPIGSWRIRNVKKRCRLGRRLYPDNPTFPFSLGVLADSDSNHIIARLWFQKGGRLSPEGPPFWRLYVATSYEMSGEHDQALVQLELAQREGLDGWLFEFYLARALCSNDRLEEALPYMYSVKSKIGWKDELITWLGMANMNLGNFWSAMYYQVLLGLAIITRFPYHGLITLIRSIAFSVLVMFSLICKLLYQFFAQFSSKRTWLFRLTRPDRLEVLLTAQLIENNCFKSAENLCQKTLRLIPESLMLRNNLALALAKQGRRDDALAQLDMAIIRYPNNNILRWNHKQISSHEKLNVRAVDTYKDIDIKLSN